MSLDAAARLAAVVPWAAAILLVISLVVLVRRHRAARDRRLRLFAHATAQGWDYDAVDRSGLAHRWTGAPFCRGVDQRAGPVITGSAGGRRFTAFDYEHDVLVPDGTGGRRTTTTWRFRVTAVDLPAVLPSLEVRPERGATRLQTAVTGDSIDLESDAFNRRFRVRSGDRRTATAVLHPKTMESLLRSPHTGTLRVEGAHVIVYDAGSHTPETIAADLSAATAFVDGIPPFIWRERGYDPSRGTARWGSS